VLRYLDGGIQPPEPLRWDQIDFNPKPDFAVRPAANHLLQLTHSDGGIAGFSLWFWLIARSTMARVAPFALLLPVFALISSAVFLGDRMTPSLAIGAVLAISGVAIPQVRPALARAG
jgi:hypothetical protein